MTRFLVRSALIVAGLAVTPAGAQILMTNATFESQLFCYHDTTGSGVVWMTAGMGVGDFNRDGYPDLYSVAGLTEPGKLFINTGAGTFSEEGIAWGLTDPFISNAVAVGDFNNDGWHDIFVTGLGPNRLFRNNGNGSFTDVADDAGVAYLPAGAAASDVETFGATWGDYDLDGDLDLLIASWSLCYCGDGNRLYRNNGDETFTDVTASALTFTALDGVMGFQPSFADMNGDLYPEILIAADFETSRYFANDGDGTFTNRTISSGTGLDDNGMGQTVFDYDNDLDLDWYVTSIHIDMPSPGDNVGNMLYTNVGEHVFEEDSVKAGINDGGWGWGVISVDLDRDGLLDVVEVNGREAKGQWDSEQAYLFHNQGNGTFTEIAVASGLAHYDSGRAVVWMDTERDGDLDVVIFTAQGPLYYFRNDTLIGSRRWLEIDFDTSNNPGLAPDGFGARIETTHAGQQQMRYMNGSPSYLGTSELMAHFGFGDGPDTLDELKVIWPRGQQTILTGFPIDRRVTVHAPDPPDITADGEIGVDDLVAVIVGWGNGVSAENLAADITLDGNVNVDDLVEVIIAWGPSTPPVDG